jgi:hypothetical protein
MKVLAYFPCFEKIKVLGYFPCFEKTEVSLCGLHAVCVCESPLLTFKCLNQSLLNLVYRGT